MRHFSANILRCPYQEMLQTDENSNEILLTN